MRRSDKFLLRPTTRQTSALHTMLADHRALYNAALQERRDAYAHPSQARIRYGDQSAQLKDIRTLDPDQARWSFSSQQATLRRLNRAFEAFFRRVKAGEWPGYPRFRSRSRFDTVEFPKDGDGCRWDSVPHDTQTRVRLQGIGHVRVHQHRPVQGRVKTISVKRDGTRWYVILSCDDVPARHLPAAGRLAEAQRHLDTFPKKVKAANRTRKHRLAARNVAGLHARIRRQRRDHAHKAANFLVRSADRIAHEKLSMPNMVRRPKPRQGEDATFEPNGAAAKTGLNKSILDAGWGVFLGILAHKAECAGRELIPVEPRNTSRTCPKCGHVAKENRDRETFECTRCGHTDHADRIAALNIATRAGLVLRAVA